ncbi:MAG: DMT family transporter [Nanoarchaeota archaeon]|nr:DMT family transporter [Nanoarchaeota archaeon]
MIYFPILGALALGGATILEKIVLRKRKVDTRLYQTASFLSLVIIMIPLIYFFWKLTPQAFELKNIFIFALVVGFSVIANLFSFFALKWEKVNNIEPARLLEPLFVILLAIGFSFFAIELYDRNMNIIVPALIAGVAIIFSHIKKHHLTFNKYFLAAIAGSFFFALELVISRLILDFYSPISFYFLRCIAIFLISFIIFKPKFEKLSTKVRGEIFGTAIVWFIYRIVIYYGYASFGVVFTTLMIMLGPIFVYAFARIFLKERLSRRNIAASIVIIGCVLYGILS